MRLNTLRSRLFLSYAAVVGTVLLFVAAALLLFSLAPFSVSIRVLPTLQRLRAVGISLERELRPLLGGAQTREQLWDALAETAAAHEGIRVLLVDPQRTVAYDSRPVGGWEGRRLPEMQSFSHLLTNLRQETAVGRIRGPDGRPWLVFTQRLPASGVEPVQIVLAAPQIGGLAFFREMFLPALWRAALAALLLSLVLAWLISRSVARPLQRMVVATEAVAEGDYEQRVPVQGPDEIKRVAGSFNQMAQRVRATQQAQRDFLINASHDLKTPLTSIQGWSQALADGTADARGQTAQAARIIQEETERMARMVSELLALARIDSGQLQLTLEPVDLTALLEDMRRNFSLQAERQQVQLTLTAERVPPLIGDADRLMQIVTNLVDNALDHTPAGGRVQLALRRLDSAWVEVSVYDTGPGIPPEELERIFERFYQVEKSRIRSQGRPGVGLGLAISRELARAHGGEIYAQSDADTGTRFTVRLPLQPAEDPDGSSA